MSIPIARYYDIEKNPEQAFLAGVPLRDLTDEEWEALPPHLQRSVDALPFYRKTKSRTSTPALPDAEATEES
jgi:hypothetical protein